MGQLLQIANGQEISVGDPFKLLRLYAEMAKACDNNTGSYNELFSIPGATMDGEPMPEGWWRSAKGQARVFLSNHGSKISEPVRDLLEHLIKGT